MATARQEIGNKPIALYTHKIPKTFFCVQCGKKHKVSDNSHYFNPHCHAWKKNNSP